MEEYMLSFHQPYSSLTVSACAAPPASQGTRQKMQEINLY